MTHLLPEDRARVSPELLAQAESDTAKRIKKRKPEHPADSSQVRAVCSIVLEANERLCRLHDAQVLIILWLQEECAKKLAELFSEHCSTDADDSPFRVTKNPITVIGVMAALGGGGCGESSGSMELDDGSLAPCIGGGMVAASTVMIGNAEDSTIGSSIFLWQNPDVVKKILDQLNGDQLDLFYLLVLSIGPLRSLNHKLQHGMTAVAGDIQRMLRLFSVCCTVLYQNGTLLLLR